MTWGAVRVHAAPQQSAESGQPLRRGDVAGGRRVSQERLAAVSVVNDLVRSDASAVHARWSAALDVPSFTSTAG